VLDVKQLVCMKMAFLRTVKEKNIVISGENNLNFIINFLACIFCSKDIFLINDLKRIQEIDFEYFQLKDETTDSNICIFPEVNTNKILINFVTSGSSGAPKLVKKTLQNLINEAFDLYEELDIKDGLEFISTTDLVHLFGMTFHFMLPFNNNFIINTDCINYPEDINIENSFLVTSPSFLEKMQKYKDLPKTNPKYIVTAGAKLENSTFAFAQTFSDKVTEIYGSTESGVIAYRNSCISDELNLFKNVKMKSLYESGVEVTTEYSLNRTNKIEDAVEILENGKIKVNGRLDRVLKIQEKRICAVEVENTLNKSYLVADSYCLKLFDKLCCVIVLNSNGIEFAKINGTIELIKKLKSYLNRGFSILPQKFKFLYEIPKTKSGKVDVNKITKIFNLNLSYPLIIDKIENGNSAVINLCFYRNCNFFKGHFEGFPLTPGVVQLFYASYFIEEVFGANCNVGQIRKMKFNNIISPDTILELKLEKSENFITYTYYNDEKKFSSGILPRENLLKGAEYERN
jgi:acyl-coenzyme A synthetase/AMP-(fatty) acid ligase